MTCGRSKSWTRRWREFAGFHVGEETLHVEDLWGTPVRLDFRLFPAGRVALRLEKAGFDVTERVEREPYPNVEYPSRRCYLFACRRPG